MAQIEWGDGIPLGESDGFTLTPSEHAPARDELPPLPREISISVALDIPDDSPIYRWPPVLAANARNN